jgi:hypothetical protein
MATGEASQRARTSTKITSKALIGIERKGLFGQRLDNRTTLVMAAVRTNAVRTDRSAALWAVLQLKRLDRVVSPAAIGAGVGMFAFWDSHDNQPSAGDAVRENRPKLNKDNLLQFRKRLIVREAPEECQAAKSWGNAPEVWRLIAVIFELTVSHPAISRTPGVAQESSHAKTEQCESGRFGRG